MNLTTPLAKKNSNSSSGVSGSNNSPISSNATLQRQYQRQNHRQNYTTAGNALQQLLFPAAHRPQQSWFFRTGMPQQQTYYQSRSSSGLYSSYWKSATTAITPSTPTTPRFAQNSAPPYKQSSHFSGSGSVKIRSSVVVIFLSIIVICAVILQGSFTWHSISKNGGSNNRPSKHPNHRRHISPLVVATASSQLSRYSQSAAVASWHPTNAPTTTPRSPPTSASDTGTATRQFDTATHHANHHHDNDTLHDRIKSSNGLLDSDVQAESNNTTDTAARHRQLWNSPTPSLQFPDWLTTYLEFHQEHVVPVAASTSQRRNRREGRQPPPRFQVAPSRRRQQRNEFANSDNQTTTQPRVLTYRCNGQSCGGIGDRLQGIVQTFYMAMCSNRIFTIDWHEQRAAATASTNDDDDKSSRATGLERYVLPHHVHWDAAVLNHAQAEPILIQAMDHRNNSLLIEPHVLLARYDHVLLSTNLWMSDTFVQSPCWQTYRSQFAAAHNVDESAAVLYRWALDALFQWSPSVVAMAATMRQRAQLPDPTTTQAATLPFVALHIRTGWLGDRGTAAQRQAQARHANPAEWSQFVQCGYRVQDALVARWCRSPDSRRGATRARHEAKLYLYLASDDRSVKEALLKEDPSLKTVLDLTLHHVDSQSRGDANDDGALAAWSELYVLHQAVCRVRSRSKYSTVAALWSPTAECTLYHDHCGRDVVELAVSSIPTPLSGWIDGTVNCG
jgi:hypothetical protein